MKARYIFFMISIVVFLMVPGVSYANPIEAPLLNDMISSNVTEVDNASNILVLVNKENYLPKDYVPEDLRSVNLPRVKGKDQLRDEAASALEAMFQDAEKAGHILYARSGYRSYIRQSAIFYDYVKKYGRTLTETFSAPPGMSEHQTGLAMDISSKAVNYALVRKFGELPEGIWVKENSWQYGFIIRYSKDKTTITKYSYEPWHLRYVGRDAAKVIHKKDITLEEYLDSVKWKDETFGYSKHQIIWELPNPMTPLFA